MVPLVIDTLNCKTNSFLPRIMPRVVLDQRTKFENDELFRKLSRDTEIKYTGFREKPLEERQLRFQRECQEGLAEIAFINIGMNLPLSFASKSWSEMHEDQLPDRDTVNFTLEDGKVHLKSQFIMNGVCVLWRGWLDIFRLEGLGCLEFDADRAQVEESLLRGQMMSYDRDACEEDRHSHDRSQQDDAEAEVVQALLNFSQADT